jgi:hypothetical protein
MEKCEVCGSPTRYGEYYGEPPVVCTNPKCENTTQYVRNKDTQKHKMAYRIGTIIWLILISLSILAYNQANGFFAAVAEAFAVFTGFVSTILYLVFLLLVFLFKWSRTSFGIALVLILILLLGLWVYWTR